MRFVVGLFLSFVIATAARADLLHEVDVELFLAVDVSRSMSVGELELQRRGYAEALSSEAVAQAVANGLIGQVAITYVEWAGSYSQRVVVPWTLVETSDDLQRFADQLVNEFSTSLRRTSISGALLYAAESFEDNSYHGLRRVIDVSGDGPNNQGRPVLRAREAVLDKGFIVNGLPLMTREGIGGQFHLDDLDLYYEACVIGGPGSFVIPVRNWEEFAQAVRRKLVLEIAAVPPPLVWRAQSRVRPDYDCLIGEKIWERMQRDWGVP
ncbi:MAG: DUF1194 domain-containing protein [Pseudomonadota bacterium]